MTNWLPIETAPEDVAVLVADPDEGVCAAKNTPIRGSAFWMPHPSSRDSESLRPTHWMPRPAAPA